MLSNELKNMEIKMTEESDNIAKGITQMDLFPVMQKEQEFCILLGFLSAHWKFNLLTELIS